MRKETSDAPPLAVRQIEIDAANAGQRLDNFLVRLCKGVPKSHLYKAIRGGEVRVNKGRVKAEYKLAIGDTVRVPPLRLPDPGARPAVPAGEFPIVYEDDCMLVVDKPAGVAVHGGSGVAFGVIERLRASRPGAPFLELVHRLDRDTSGLLMLAKRRNALLALHAMLREGKSDKHYTALVTGDWQNDRQHIRFALHRWTTQTGERRVNVDPAGQAAHTIVTLKQRYGLFSLVDAELRTGRTHQIRVHLAHSGYPIAGDDKYGDAGVNAGLAQQGFKRMFLHAHTLRLAHPLTGEMLELTAELPPAYTQLIEHLEAQ